MWRWKTVCQAAAPQELIRLTPSAPSRSRPAGPAAGRRPRPRRRPRARPPQVGGVVARDHQRVATRRRADVHERHRALVGSRPAGTGARRRRSCRTCSRDPSSARSLLIGGRSRDQLPRAVDRLLGRADLAAERLRLQLGQQPTDPRARLDPERPGELVAAHRRRGGFASQASASVSICAPAPGAWRSRARRCRRGSRAGRRRSAASRRRRPASRPAGSRRRRGATSGTRCTRKPSRRWCSVSAATYAQSFSDARSRRRIYVPSSAPARSWPMNVTRPSSVTSRVWGLAMSCSSAPNRSAWPRVRPLANGALEQRPQRCRLLRALAQKHRIFGDLDRLGQHQPRVTEHVEMVKAALLDAVERVELGQHRGGDPERAQQPDPVRARVCADQPLELFEDALGGDRRQPRRGCAGGLRRPELDLEPQFARQPRQPHRRAADRRGTRRPTPPAGSGREDPRCRRTDRRGRRRRRGSAIALTSGRAGPGPARSSRRQAPSGPAASSGRGRPPARRRTPPTARTRARARRGRPPRAQAAASPATTTSKSDGRAAEQPVAHGAADEPAGVPSSASARSGGSPLTPSPPPVTVVDARHPAADPADHLVVDRADPPRQVLGGLALAAVAADQDRPRRRPPRAGRAQGRR